MSNLFGEEPETSTAPLLAPSAAEQGRSSLFADEPATTKSNSSALFADDENTNVNPGVDSPWDLASTSRRQ